MSPKQRLAEIKLILAEWGKECEQAEYTDTDVLWSNVVPDIGRLCDLEDADVNQKMHEGYHVPYDSDEEEHM